MLIRVVRLVPLILSLTGCLFWTMPAGGNSSPPPAPPCPTDKIAFAQAQGCLNDGSVEFCIPTDDPAALASVQAIAPNVVCMQAGGRARCKLDTEILCLLPTDGLCNGYHEAMTDQGWQTVCALASLPTVRQIVPTWYE